jgi:hypothetical protein
MNQFLAFGDGLTGPAPRQVDFVANFPRPAQPLASSSPTQSLTCLQGVWTLQLARALNLSLCSYAHYGAIAQGVHTSRQGQPFPDFHTQQVWAGLNRGRYASVWFGTHDYLLAERPLQAVDSVLAAIAQGVTNLLTRVDKLCLVNLYALDQLPYSRRFSGAKRSELAQAVARHNQQLQQYSDTCQRVVLVDAHQLVREFNRPHILYADSLHLGFAAQTQLAQQILVQLEAQEFHPAIPYGGHGSQYGSSQYASPATSVGRSRSLVRQAS